MNYGFQVWLGDALYEVVGRSVITFRFLCLKFKQSANRIFISGLRLFSYKPNLLNILKYCLLERKSSISFYINKSCYSRYNFISLVLLVLSFYAFTVCLLGLKLFLKLLIKPTVVEIKVS